MKRTRKPTYQAPRNSAVAHKGYLIKPSSDGAYFIEKDGYFITYAFTVESAKREIDASLT